MIKLKLTEKEIQLIISSLVNKKGFERNEVPFDNLISKIREQIETQKEKKL